MGVLVLLSLLAAFSTETCLGNNNVRSSTIASIAKRYATEGSQQFLWSSEMPKWSAPKDSDKSHLFVAQVLKEAGIPVPKRNYRSGLPIGAVEWANPHSFIFRMTNCWKRCSGQYQLGDVIAMNNHVAIVTSYWGSTSPAIDSVPLGVVKKSRWGFRTGDAPFCRRFLYRRLYTHTCYHY